MAKARRRGRPAPDRRLPSTTARRYPRTARVNEILRQILAEAIERFADSDDRLMLLTVTGVHSDPEFRTATLFFASLNADAREALADIRLRLQATIAAQVRLKRTPQLAFAVDPAITTGKRVEEILRDLQPTEPEEEPDER